MLTSVSTLTVRAWKGMRMPELFIKGRYLMAKDMNGNDSIVNLHGFGQTYSPYFNGYAWCKNADGSVKWDWDSQHNASKCTYWNKNQISYMLKKDGKSTGFASTWILFGAISKAYRSMERATSLPSIPSCSRKILTLYSSM